MNWLILGHLTTWFKSLCERIIGTQFLLWIAVFHWHSILFVRNMGCKLLEQRINNTFLVKLKKTAIGIYIMLSKFIEKDQHVKWRSFMSEQKMLQTMKDWIIQQLQTLIQMQNWEKWPSTDFWTWSKSVIWEVSIEWVSEHLQNEPHHSSLCSNVKKCSMLIFIFVSHTGIYGTVLMHSSNNSTNYKVKVLPSAVDSYLVGQYILCCGTQRFITVIRKACHWPLS